MPSCARSRPRSPRRSTWRRTLRPWSASGNLKRLTGCSAVATTLEALQRFAKGLYEDYEAVKAGVTLPWSTGPVEGHINRLKMLKRQMFGRVRLDLLSRRFVEAPRGTGPGCPPTCTVTGARRGRIATRVVRGIGGMRCSGSSEVSRPEK